MTNELLIFTHLAGFLIGFLVHNQLALHLIKSTEPEQAKYFKKGSSASELFKSGEEWTK